MSTNPRSELESEFLQTLTHETPYFLFSKKKIVSGYEHFKKCFPHAQIYYAMKANAEPEFLETLAKAGSGFEVASAYELKMLQDLSIPPQTIIYGTSVKPQSHIKEFYRYGVDRYAFDSLPELEKIAVAAPGSSVYVRVLVNDTGSVYRFSEKFGTDKNNAAPLLLSAKELGLRPYGISFHVGSQASNPMAWAEALESIASVLVELKKNNIEIEIINIGGGFPCAYASTEKTLALEDIAAKTMNAYKKLPYQPKLMLEPGRGIAAESGVLISSVIAKVERKENEWLFLDAGVYSALFEAMAYQGSVRYKITSLRPSYNSGESMFALAGPTGDSPDVITHEALLPQDIDVGDKLIIHDVGAYNTVVSNRMNGFPKPGVYFV